MKNIIPHQFTNSKKEKKEKKKKFALKIELFYQLPLLFSSLTVCWVSHVISGYLGSLHLHS